MQHFWFAHALLPGGWAERVRIGVENGRIACVEPQIEPLTSDERHGAALPGLCNVHSHGFQRGMAGLSERRGRPDDDFWSWREVMYRFLDQLSPDDIAAITAQAYVEMLESGYTRVGEFHYLHNDVDGRPYADPAETAGAIVAAAETAGIELTLLPVFYAHGDFGGAPPASGQKRFVSDLDGFARLVEASRAKLPADANLGLAPHSLRAVTPDELRALVPLAGHGPIHIHAAEQVREVEACVAWSGARPVEWLLGHADVGERWCLIHATHMTGDECVRLAASGAVAGLCPVTEANLGDGVFPAADYLAAGGRFATGTDSNILVDAAGELRALEYSQRLTHRRRAVLADEARPSIGERLFAGALAGGAQALGFEHGLAVGAPADLVALDLNHVGFAGADSATLLDRWIFGIGRSAIDAVWRGGRKVVANRRHIAAEPVAVRYRATPEAAARVTIDARIRAEIEARIQSGEWRPGDRVPYEHELVVTYACSRATVSKALGALARAGLIERRRKAGSFVAHPQVHSAVLDIPDLQQIIEARGEAYGWRRTLRQPGDDVVQVEGVHYGGGEPFALEQRVIRFAVVPAAEKESFASESPGAWLLRHVPWTSAEHRIRAVEPRRAEANALGVRPRAACLELQRTTWRAGAVVTEVRQLFRGDRFDLVAAFRPGTAGSIR